MEKLYVNGDIELYIELEMQRDRKLRRMDNHLKRLAKATLVERADGMFRWVWCQLDQIKRLGLLTSEHVNKALRELPIGLDRTYERALVQLNDIPEAKTALMWLAFSMFPLTLEQLREACIIKSDALEETNRNAIETFLVEMSPLIQVTQHSDNDLRSIRPKITLAHHTVKEYLMSERLRNGPAKEWFLQERLCHYEISRACMVYLGYTARLLASAMRATLPIRHSSGTPEIHRIVETAPLQRSLSLNDLRQYVLLVYAMCCGISHLQQCGSYVACATNYDIETSKPAIKGQVDEHHHKDFVPGCGLNNTSPLALDVALILACMHGDYALVKFLLQLGASVDFNETLLMNTPSEDCEVTALTGNALFQAILQGDGLVMKVLLAHRANPNALFEEPCPRRYGLYEESSSVLYKRSYHKGIRSIVEDGSRNSEARAWRPQSDCEDDSGDDSDGWRDGLFLRRPLLDTGVDPSMHLRGTYSAFQMAIYHRKLAAVRVLVEYGADVNYVPPGTVSPLHIACSRTCAGNIPPRHATTTAALSPVGLGEATMLIAIDVVDYLLTAGASTSGISLPLIVQNWRLALRLQYMKFGNVYLRHSTLGDGIYLVPPDPKWWTGAFYRTVDGEMKTLHRGGGVKTESANDYTLIYIRLTESDGTPARSRVLNKCIRHLRETGVLNDFAPDHLEQLISDSDWTDLDQNVQDFITSQKNDHGTAEKQQEEEMDPEVRQFLANQDEGDTWMLDSAGEEDFASSDED